jgi:hypothetical protein
MSAAGIATANMTSRRPYKRPVWTALGGVLSMPFRLRPAGCTSGVELGTGQMRGSQPFYSTKLRRASVSLNACPSCGIVALVAAKW